MLLILSHQKHGVIPSKLNSEGRASKSHAHCRIDVCRMSVLQLLGLTSFLPTIGENIGRASLEKRGCGKSLFLSWEITAALRLSEAFRARVGRVVGFCHKVGSESCRLWIDWTLSLLM